MAKYRKFTSQSHLADMSVPPAQRGRKRKQKGRGTKGVIAQLGHANGSHYASDQRRKWEKQNSKRRRMT